MQILKKIYFYKLNLKDMFKGRVSKYDFVQGLISLFFFTLNIFRKVNIKFQNKKNICQNIESLKIFVWLFYKTRHRTYLPFNIDKNKQKRIFDLLGISISPTKNITGNLILKSRNYLKITKVLRKKFEDYLNKKNPHLICFVDFFYLRYIGYKIGISQRPNFDKRNNKRYFIYTNKLYTSNKLPIYTTGVWNCWVGVIVTKKDFSMIHGRPLNESLKVSKKFVNLIKENTCCKVILFSKEDMDKFVKDKKLHNKNIKKIKLKKNYKHSFVVTKNKNKVHIYYGKTLCKFEVPPYYNEYKNLISTITKNWNMNFCIDQKKIV